MDVINTSDYKNFKPRYDSSKYIRNTKTVAIQSNERRLRIEDGELFYLPFEKTHNAFNFRPQELTLWAGETKSMKSMLTGFFLMSLALQNQVVSIASLEMPLEDTYDRMCSAFTGRQDFTPKQSAEFANLMYKKLWFLDHESTIGIHEVENFIAFSAEVLNVNHVMIDSLMMIHVEHAKDNNLVHKMYKDFIVSLKNLAKMYEIQVHLVTHFRKPEHGRPPNRYDIFGTSSIPNIADNIFMISRNRDSDAIEPDLYLKLDSQRKGKDDITYGLWLDDSFQFLPSYTSAPLSPEEFKQGRYLT